MEVLQEALVADEISPMGGPSDSDPGGTGVDSGLDRLRFGVRVTLTLGSFSDNFWIILG